MNNWEDELEWETNPELNVVVKDPYNIEKIEEKKKIQKIIEQEDNKLTDELFGRKLEEEGTKILSIKEKGTSVINKIKSSGTKLVDHIVKKDKKRNIKKIYDEFTLSKMEHESVDIEDKYFSSKRT